MGAPANVRQQFMSQGQMQRPAFNQYQPMIPQGPAFQPVPMNQMPVSPAFGANMPPSLPPVNMQALYGGLNGRADRAPSMNPFLARLAQRFPQGGMRPQMPADLGMMLPTGLMGQM